MQTLTADPRWAAVFTAAGLLAAHEPRMQARSRGRLFGKGIAGPSPSTIQSCLVQSRDEGNDPQTTTSSLQSTETKILQLWLRCHVPVAIAFESCSVLAVRCVHFGTPPSSSLLSFTFTFRSERCAFFSPRGPRPISSKKGRPRAHVDNPHTGGERARRGRRHPSRRAACTLPSASFAASDTQFILAVRVLVASQSSRSFAAAAYRAGHAQTLSFCLPCRSKDRGTRSPKLRPPARVAQARRGWSASRRG